MQDPGYGPAPLLPSCVNVGKLPDPSEPHFLAYEMDAAPGVAVRTQ